MFSLAWAASPGDNNLVLPSATLSTLASQKTMLASAAISSPPELDLWSEVTQVAGLLLALMAFAILVAKLSKRFHTSALKGVEVRPLGGHVLAPGVAVRLLQIGERIFLVGFTRENITLLAELSADDLSKKGEEVTKTNDPFWREMQKAWHRENERATTDKPIQS